MEFHQTKQHIHIYLTNIYNKEKKDFMSILELFLFIIYNGIYICIVLRARRN